jgi:hypothetical protein
MSVQVQDGSVIVGSAYTLIEGLSQDARVTRADEDGLVLGFELQDGPKSMVDIALGKVSPFPDHIQRPTSLMCMCAQNSIIGCTFIWSSFSCCCT